MVDNREYWSSANEEGSIKISEDVVASIASIEVAETEGVYSLTTTLTGEIVEFLGKKNLSKGVKVAFDGNNVDIDICYIIKAGYNLIDVSKKIQENVKTAVESMTGLHLSSANINIIGVNQEK